MRRCLALARRQSPPAPSCAPAAWWQHIERVYVPSRSTQNKTRRGTAAVGRSLVLVLEPEPEPALVLVLEPVLVPVLVPVPVEAGRSGLPHRLQRQEPRPPIHAVVVLHAQQALHAQDALALPIPRQGKATPRSQEHQRSSIS